MSAREDLAEEVKQMLDNAAVVMVGEQPKTKPARTRTLKPTVGFIVVARDWDPRDPHGRLSLWNPHPTRKAAESERADRANVAGGRRMIVRVDTTYTVVDDGGSDG